MRIAFMCPRGYVREHHAHAHNLLIGTGPGHTCESKSASILNIDDDNVDDNNATF